MWVRPGGVPAGLLPDCASDLIGTPPLIPGLGSTEANQGECFSRVNRESQFKVENSASPLDGLCWVQSHKPTPPGGFGTEHLTIMQFRSNRVDVVSSAPSSSAVCHGFEEKWGNLFVGPSTLNAVTHETSGP